MKRNITIISVDGDRNFGPWVSYLEQLRIPWLILADGPVLSPNYPHSLSNQLGLDPNTGKAAYALNGKPPGSDEFDAWRDYWRANQVMTVATTFGLKPMRLRRRRHPLNPEKLKVGSQFSMPSCGLR
ncbi:MAG: TOPRIM nucleotidyl transferase/hydrolase domain-containing protein [Jatrophihabitantaceae bacterium]